MKVSDKMIREMYRRYELAGSVKERIKIAKRYGYEPEYFERQIKREIKKVD